MQMSDTNKHSEEIEKNIFYIDSVVSQSSFRLKLLFDDLIILENKVRSSADLYEKIHS